MTWILLVYFLLGPAELRLTMAIRGSVQGWCSSLGHQQKLTIFMWVMFSFFLHVAPVSLDCCYCWWCCIYTLTAYLEFPPTEKKPCFDAVIRAFVSQSTKLWNWILWPSTVVPYRKLRWSCDFILYDTPLYHFLRILLGDIHTSWF